MVSVVSRTGQRRRCMRCFACPSKGEGESMLTGKHAEVSISSMNAHGHVIHGVRC
jgi:hypothetical protein